MQRSLAPYFLAAASVAAVAWFTSAFLPALGLASAALLFLLPVLLSSSRGGVGPGLLAAISGAAAYNFLLLPPRFTLRVHGFDNVVSVFVLVAVALVTSRLATRLEQRRAEADARAKASQETAELAAVLAEAQPADGVDAGVAWIAERYGPSRVVERDAVSEASDTFNSLDASAAAWALHNVDMTGHGTSIMPAADWTFLPLAPHSRGDARVIVAVARPDNGGTRSEGELAQLQQLAFLLGQAWDRAALSQERRERERLEVSEALRRGILSSLAHDFRTPLTVIAGQLESLSPGPPAVDEALAATRRLDRMMEDLLGAARLESGELAPATESIDLVDAVSAACETAAMPAALQIERQLPADLPFVRAEPMLLHHILLNLLDNAARHAAGKVMIAAVARRSCVELVVADDGPGISADDRQRLFERFVRLTGSDRTHGSGLGLSIVKGFADAMDIEVAVDERPGGGARFTLTLPVAPEGMQ